MGRHKTLLKVSGVPLIVHTARLLAPLVSKVTVVGSARRYTGLGLHTIDDRVPRTDARPKAARQKVRVGLQRQLREGPLAGITRALETTTAPWNLIVAGDLPYLSLEWIGWLLSRAIKSRAQIVIPRTTHGLEPLGAVYRRECAAPIDAAFGAGVRKVTDALAGLTMEIVDVGEWAAVDADGRVLKNMNTPADYAEARKWWASRESADFTESNEPMTAPARGKPKRRSKPGQSPVPQSQVPKSLVPKKGRQSRKRSAARRSR